MSKHAYRRVIVSGPLRVFTAGAIQDQRREKESVQTHGLEQAFLCATASSEPAIKLKSLCLCVNVGILLKYICKSACQCSAAFRTLCPSKRVYVGELLFHLAKLHLDGPLEQVRHQESPLLDISCSVGFIIQGAFQNHHQVASPP